MAMRAYHDFIIFCDPEDVRTGEHGELRQFSVRVFDSPVGQGENKETVEVPPDLQFKCSSLAQCLLDDDVTRQIELGTLLANLMLPKYARHLYEASLARLPEDEGLRLQLRLARVLSAFPWEYMYIQRTDGERVESDFLALDVRVSIVRHDAMAVPVPGDWFQAPTERRVVVAMASPVDRDWRRLPALVPEQHALKAALDDVDGLVVEYLPHVYGVHMGDEIPGATLEQLGSALMERADIFHFSGHGQFEQKQGPVFDTVVGKGSILLATEDNRPDPLPASRLGEMLRSKGVRLVALGACETAQTGYRDMAHTWGGVSVSLLREGIPAVLAMQYTVNDRLAARFMAAFYRSLVLGHLIDEAVAHGRSAMRREALRRDGLNRPHIRDWGAPVLALRAPGGRVFRPVDNEAARQKAGEALGPLVRETVRVLEAGGLMVGAVNTRSARVELKVQEEARGLMVGGKWREHPPDRHEIQMEADRLTGAMVGPTEGDDDALADAIAGLQGLADSQSRRSGTHRIQERPSTGSSARPGAAAPIVTPEGTERAGGARTCPQCGSAVQMAWRACAFCGATLKEQHRCPNCGEALQPDWMICPICSTRLKPLN